MNNSKPNPKESSTNTY